jgi:hypothetical protein
MCGFMSQICFYFDICRCHSSGGGYLKLGTVDNGLDGGALEREDDCSLN